MSRIALSVLLMTALTACGSDAEAREDLETQPASPAASAQPAPTAQPAPAAPTQPVRAIPAGTVLTFEVGEDVSTSSHVSGDAFSLALVDGVTGPADATLAAGTPARGLVTAVHRSTGPEDEAVLGVRVDSIQVGGSLKPVEGVVQSAAIEGSTRDSGARTAATIATGAAAGAVIGQVLGGDTRSTVTGAAVGTAVGVGVALTTRGGDATLTQGSRIVLELDRDLVF